jgi:hypothetical protein
VLLFPTPAVSELESEREASSEMSGDMGAGPTTASQESGLCGLEGAVELLDTWFAKATNSSAPISLEIQSMQPHTDTTERERD